MDLALRPMSTAQVLDRTFQLYRSNFLLFAGIASLPPAILLVVQALGLLGGSVGGAQPIRPTPGTTPDFSPAAIAGIGFGFFVFIGVFLLGHVLALGATIFAVSRVHLGRDATIGRSYGQIGRFTGKLILIVILTFLIMMGATFVFIFVAMMPAIVLRTAGISGFVTGALTFVLFVAGIVWVIRLWASISLAAPACVLEQLGALASIGRSRVLAKGSLFRIFLLYLLALIIALALSAALSIPNYIAAGTGITAYRVPLAIWGILAGFVAGTLAGPVGTISTALVYYDQRVRKEAFDLQLMMEAVGVAQPAQAQAQAAGGTAPSIG